MPPELTVTLPTLPLPLRMPVLLTVTELLGLSEPLIARLPPLITVGAVYVLTPEKTSVPVPVLITVQMEPIVLSITPAQVPEPLLTPRMRVVGSPGLKHVTAPPPVKAST